MPDEIDHEQPKKKSLSEISHLFLTSVRENATGGVRPTRLPPGSFPVGGPLPPSTPTDRAAASRDLSIDLTPEEFADRFGGGLDGLDLDPPATDPTPGDASSGDASAGARPPVGPVSAVICPQLGGRQAERVRDYARHLAAGGDRVGLIEVDADECRVTCFELCPGDPIDAAAADPARPADARSVGQALEELAWDVDRWVVRLGNPRQAEARALLGNVRHWTLLGTCDHDGVVSCYRAIKGLAENPRPRLTLALLDAADAAEAGRVHRKIAGVCQQFLDWPLSAEPAVEATDAVAEHLALVYRPRDGRAGGPWQTVSDFLVRAGEDAAEPRPLPSPATAGEGGGEGEFVRPKPSDVRRQSQPDPLPADREGAWEPAPVELPIPTTYLTDPRPSFAPEQPMTPVTADVDPTSEVSDLPGGEATESAVLAAVMGRTTDGLVACPIHPPGCPTAAVAVGRDRRLVLLAVAGRGLGQVRAIANAYRWVTENRPLLSMALPQFAIDAAAAPRLRLVVDRSDAGADLLLPMADNANVSIQTYRKLTWGGRVGLLLEAA